MVVVHVITGLDDGGAEAVLYRLISATSFNEHRVISLMGEGKYGPLLRDQGVPVLTLGMPRGRLTWRGMKRLLRVLRDERPDVVQTWMYHANLLGGLLARFVGIASVVWGIHNSTLMPGATLWVARVCALLSWWIPRRIVVCAEQAAAVHSRLGYARQKMAVIPNGYDVRQFSSDVMARQRLRAEWGVRENEALIGMVARWDPQKDHANLMAALASLLERSKLCWKAVLVGPGMDVKNRDLVAMRDRHGLVERVRLLGPRGDIPAVMNALDVHVLSSAYGEAFPNVLAEAMACGTPSVTTDVGDAALIVGDTGWVVPPRSEQLLAKAMEHALQQWAEDCGQWRQRQQAARERIVHSFSLDTMAQRYRQVWEEARHAGND